MLHGVSSLQLEQMPMTGRRRTASRLNPPARRKARFGHPVMGSANASPVIGVDLPAMSARLVIGPPSLGCAPAEAQTEVVKLASRESSAHRNQRSQSIHLELPEFFDLLRSRVDPDHGAGLAVGSAVVAS
jgi:hypothetical protein